MAEVSLSPGRPGSNRVRLTVSGPSGPLDPKEVTLGLSNKAAGVEPIERRATKLGPGIWEADTVVLPVPGPWEIRLDILISDFDKAVLEGRVEVSP
jgi:copper transport protein